MKTEMIPLAIYLTLDIMSFSLVLPCFSKVAAHLIDNFSSENDFLKFIISKGVVWSIASFSQFLFSPLLGHLSDLYGRKVLIYFTTFIQILSNLLWISFPNSLFAFFLVRTMIGISRSNIGIVTAHISDVFPLDQRSKGMAVVGVSYSIAFLFGPILGVLLSNRIDDISVKSQILAFTCMMFNLVSLFPITYFHSDKPTEKVFSLTNLVNPLKMVQFKHIENVEKQNLFCYYALSYIVFISSFSGLETSLVYIGDEHFNYTSRDQGYMFSTIGIVMIIIQGSILRRQKTLSNITLINISMISLMVSYCLIGILNNFHSLFVVGQIFFGIASSLYIPSINSQTSILSEANTHGLTMGIFRSLNALSRSIGPLVVSTMIWTFGTSKTVLITSFIIGVLAVYFNKLNHSPKPKKI